MNSILALAVSLLLAACLTLAHTLLKYVSLSGESDFLPVMLESKWTLGTAASIYVAIFLAYTFILRLFPMSVVFPAYTGLSILGVMIVSVLWFREPISPMQAVGACLLVAGVLLVSMGSNDSDRELGSSSVALATKKPGPS